MRLMIHMSEAIIDAIIEAIVEIQISATALLRDGVAGRPCVLCPELSTRVLVDGLWF